MSLRKIQQQYYTRGQQGIFRSNEGYDTIAKSPQLDNNFIKKTLHPFCGYDAPRELQERSEKDIRLYPESIALFHAESGEIVLGRSTYVGADFTGQRNTFFTHNYVIPGELREVFIKKPEKIFSVKHFVSTHDISSGKDLEELLDIPCGQPLSSQEKKQLLDKLGIDKTNYKQLLFAVMSSISSKKKVYISLDVDVSESSMYARKLLEIIYESLPYEMRRNFGFITYGNEPQSKKHINVMFVEKGSIRPGDRNIEKEFLFDYPNKRFVNVDLSGNQHEYLNYSWENLYKPDRRRDFYEFAEEVLSGSDASKATHIATYYELCTLFLVEKGRVGIYQDNKISILTSLLQMLQDQNLQNKARLQDLMKGLFREERNELDTTKKLPALDCIKLFIDYERIANDESITQQMVLFLITIILQSREASQRPYACDIYKLLIPHKHLFTRIITNALNNKRLVSPLFEEYMEYRLEKVPTIKDWLDEIGFWASVSTKVMENLIFKKVVQKRMLELLGQERDLSSRVSEIHKFFERLGKKGEFTEEILETACRLLMKKVELHSLAFEEFQRILLILNNLPQTFITELDRESRMKGKILQNLHRLLDQGDSIEPEDFFSDLTREEISQTQRLIQQFLKDKLDSQQFDKLVYAFYSDSTSAEGCIHYYPLLMYVHQQSKVQTVYPFVAWSVSQEYFTSGSKLNPSYRKALKNYFLNEGIELVQKREALKSWSRIRHADFRKLVEEIRDENSNGVTRFFRKNLGPIAVGTASVFAVGMISFLVLLFMGKLNPKPVPNSTPKEIEVPAVQETPQPTSVPEKPATESTIPETDQPSNNSETSTNPKEPINQKQQDKKTTPSKETVPPTKTNTTKPSTAKPNTTKPTEGEASESKEADKPATSPKQ